MIYMLQLPTPHTCTNKKNGSVNKVEFPGLACAFGVT